MWSQEPRKAKCFRCGIEGANKTCSKCSLAIYCSRDCQVQDWRSRHKTSCQPELERAFHNGLILARMEYEDESMDGLIAQLKTLHKLMFNVSSIADFVQGTIRSKEEVEDAFMIYRRSAEVARRDGSRGAAWAILKDIHVVIDEVCSDWAEKFDIITELAEFLVVHGNFAEDESVLRKYISEADFLVNVGMGDRGKQLTATPLLRLAEAKQTLSTWLLESPDKDKHREDILRFNKGIEELVDLVLAKAGTRPSSIYRQALELLQKVGKLWCEGYDFERGEQVLINAVETARKGLPLTTVPSQILATLAEVYEKNGRLKDAEQQYRLCLAEAKLPYEDSAKYRNNITLLLLKQGDLEGASAFKKATVDEGFMSEGPAQSVNREKLASLFNEMASSIEQDGSSDDVTALLEKMAVHPGGGKGEERSKRIPSAIK